MPYKKERERERAYYVVCTEIHLHVIVCRSSSTDNITEGEVLVDPKHHKHFVARRGEVLRRISDDYGGVLISFPRQGKLPKHANNFFWEPAILIHLLCVAGTDSHHVSLKGSKECVELAKKRILEIVYDLESQVTIDCVIPQRHHRVVMGPRGSKVNWKIELIRMSFVLMQIHIQTGATNYIRTRCAH